MVALSDQTPSSVKDIQILPRSDLAVSDLASPLDMSDLANRWPNQNERYSNRCRSEVGKRSAYGLSLKRVKIVDFSEKLNRFAC